MLNDFAFAVPKDVAVPYAGTVLFAADEVLGQLPPGPRDQLSALVEVTVFPRTWHDLESAVKVAAAYHRREVKAKLLLLNSRDPAEVRHAWQELESNSPLLTHLLALARASKYDELCKNFSL